MGNTIINSRAVLLQIVVQVLAEAGGRLELQSIYKNVRENYALPKAWDRLVPRASGKEVEKKTGFKNWRDVDPQILKALVPTEPQWQNEIRYLRIKLVKLRLLNPLTCPWGIWEIELDKLRSTDLRLNLTAEEKDITTKRKPELTVEPPPLNGILYKIECKNKHLMGYAEVPTGQKPHSIAVRCADCDSVASIGDPVKEPDLQASN